ncbi:TRAP transporter small permease [Hydrogenophaga intermedia]|uniref:TRAP transporter small permease n=1 Tax=Hydrogenophaga intermedia TaxID=65786 RepID=UPI0020439AE2|nr:TRAP transporter small permease subunit [Hydrogenophaga intermedia]MCM3564924.1 TRAP transporter small permease subunit [Hydrogenophaga intermedia]
MLATIERGLERLAVWLAAAGAIIIVVQTVWISYGVFMRYVVGKPDGTVTEATALLLFPAALLGLAFALREDAYPKVSFLIDALGPRGRQLMTAVNLVLMIVVGIFFSIAGVEATVRAYESGTASEILLWPRYLFWAPGALALVVFTVYACVRLLSVLSSPLRPAPQQR